MAAKTSISSGILYTDRRDFYISPNVVNELHQDVTPFTTFLGKAGSISVNDPVFKQFEYRNGWLDQYVITSEADQNAGAAGSVTVGNAGTTVDVLCSAATPGLGRNTQGASQWNERELATPSFDSSAVGLVLQYKTGDNLLNLRVTSASNATLTCSVIAKVGTVASIPVSAKLHVVGSAFAEGGVAPDASSDDITVVWGRTQIMKTSIEVTGTLYHMALRGYSDELARLRAEKMKEHKIQKERSFLLGIDPSRSAYDTALTSALDNSDTRYSMGVIPSIIKFGKSYEATDNAGGKKANIFSFDATTSYSTFVDMMENLFAYIPSSQDSKIVFCGAGVLSFFSKPDAQALFKIGSTNNPFTLSEPIKTEWGFNVRKLNTPHGSISLAHAPVLRGDWRNYGVAIDTDYVKNYVFRPTSYTTAIKTDNAYDGVKDQIMSDEGVGLSMIEKHALIKVA